MSVNENGNQSTRLTARFVMLMCDRVDSVTSEPDDVTKPAQVDVSEAAIILADWVLNEYDDWKTRNGKPTWAEVVADVAETSRYASLASALAEIRRLCDEADAGFCGYTTAMHALRAIRAALPEETP